MSRSPREEQKLVGRQAVHHYRKLKNGDRKEVIESVKSRNVGDSVRDTSNSSSYEVSDREFLVLNEIGPIIDTRIREVPTGWKFKPQDEDAAAKNFAEKCNEWAGVGSEDDDGLYSATPEILEDQEQDGVAAIVFGKDGDEVWHEVRDASQVSVTTDPMNARRIVKVCFDWSVFEAQESGEPLERRYREEITETERVLYLDDVEIEGSRSTYGIGMVPVVLVPRVNVKGSHLAPSGVADLEEAQAAYLWSFHLLNTANKYTSAPVTCPEPSDDDGAMLPDQDNAGTTIIRLSPGIFIPVPIRAVTGPISPTLVDQVEKTLEALRRLGHVRERGADDADARSAKSMLVGSDSMRNYVLAKLRKLKAGLRQAATIWGRFSGMLALDETAPVYAEFPSTEDDDTAESTKRGELWLKVRMAGEIGREDFYRQLQRIKMLDEDDDPKTLADNAAEESEAEAEKLASQMTDQIASQQPPVEAMEDAGHEEPQGPPGMVMANG